MSVCAYCQGFYSSFHRGKTLERLGLSGWGFRVLEFRVWGFQLRWFLVPELSRGLVWHVQDASDVYKVGMEWESYTLLGWIMVASTWRRFRVCRFRD